MESEADSTLNRGKKRNLEENEKDIWGGAETRAQKRRMEEKNMEKDDDFEKSSRDTFVKPNEINILPSQTEAGYVPPLEPSFISEPEKTSKNDSPEFSLPQTPKETSLDTEDSPSKDEVSSPSSTKLPLDPSIGLRDYLVQSENSSENIQNVENPDELDTFKIQYAVKDPRIFKNQQARAFTAIPKRPSNDYAHAIGKYKNVLAPFIEEQRTEKYKHGVKCHLSVKARFHVVKNDPVEIVDKPEPNFTAKSVAINQGEDVLEKIEPILQRLEEQIIDYVDRGSGFVFSQIMEFRLTLANYQAFRVGKFIKTPEKIEKIRATVNVLQSKTENDSFCFIDSVNAVVFPVKGKNNPNRAYHYKKYRSHWNIKGLKLPVQISDISKFERLNPSLSINIYAVDLNARSDNHPYFYPYKISSNRGDDKKVVNLLLLEEGENYHFVAIKCLRRLTTKAYSNHHTSKNEKICCPYCLQHIKTHVYHTRHKELCQNFKPITTELPPQGTTLEFSEYGRSCPVDYYITADMESREILMSTVENKPEYALSELEQKTPYEWVKYPSQKHHALFGQKGGPCLKCSPLKPCEAIEMSTKINSRLELFSFAFQVISDDPSEKFPLKIHQAENSMKEFILSLKETSKILHEKIRANVPIHWRIGEKEKHRAQTGCNCCKSK